MRRLLGITLLLLCLLVGCLALAVEASRPEMEAAPLPPTTAARQLTRPEQSRRPPSWRRASRQAELWQVIRAGGQDMAELEPDPCQDPLEGIDLDELMVDAVIRGRVEDSEGRGIPAMRVEAKPHNILTYAQIHLLPDPSLGVITDEDGSFQLEVPAAGPYLITVRWRGRMVLRQQREAREGGPDHVLVVPMR